MAVSTHWQRLQVWVNEGVGHLRLNRPQRRNALDLETALELDQAVGELGRSADVILLRGNGGTFCAGADLEMIRRASSDPTQIRHYLESLNRAFDQVEQVEVPVIAVVEGFALAGGFELLQCCDFVLVADDAILGDQHANFGLIPGAGGSQRLPRLIGRQRALSLLLSGDWLRGVDAVAAGLAYRSYPPDKLDSEALALGRRLTKHSRSGMAHMKSLVDRGLRLSIGEGIGLEIETLCDFIGTADPQEGLSAFAERREPRFVDGRSGQVNPK